VLSELVNSMTAVKPVRWMTQRQVMARIGRSNATAVMSSIHIRKTQMRRYLSLIESESPTQVLKVSQNGKTRLSMHHKSQPTSNGGNSTLW
jgi:hypothetical protein